MVADRGRCPASGDPHVTNADGIATGGGAGQVTEILDGIAVNAGTKENLVLKADGTVWRWRGSGR